MIAKVDWNNEGFVPGSSTFEEDWKLLECVSNEALVYDTSDLERVCNVSGKGEVVTEQHLANVSTDFRV